MDYNKIINYFYPEEQNAALRDILYVHSRGVADLALECCERHPELGIDKEFAEAAAMLHDIGIVMCDAAGIECYGTEPYICHGRLGASMLRTNAEALGYTASELEPYARVCERHTGAGLTAKDIITQNLPLPHEDFLPETIEEKLVCYADKFFSKTHPDRRKPYDRVEASLSKFGGEGLIRFREWHDIFQ